MRIAIDVNGVLRDTIGKFKNLYEKHLIDGYQEFPSQTYAIDKFGKTELLEQPTQFEYKILSPTTTLDLQNHFAFQSEEEYYSFMYEEYCMELFGHAPSTEMTTFNDLNEIYVEHRRQWDFMVLSDEIGKSKPATLFFLSKFGCELEKVFFYSNFTINSIWNEFDVLLTSNPNLLLNYPKEKILIKFETEYNKDINSKYSIQKIKELDSIINKILC